MTWRLFSNDQNADLFVGLCAQSILDAEPDQAADKDKARFVKTLFKPVVRVEKLGLHALHYHQEAAESIS